MTPTLTAPRFRQRFPTLADSTYLASHSMGAPPIGARDVLIAYWEAWAKDGPEAWNEWLPALQDLADNLGAIFGAEAEVLVQAHANVVAVESIRVLLLVKQHLLENDRDRGFA